MFACTLRHFSWLNWDTIKSYFRQQVQVWFLQGRLAILVCERRGGWGDGDWTLSRIGTCSTAECSPPSLSHLGINLFMPIYLRQVGKWGHFMSKYSVVAQMIKKNNQARKCAALFSLARMIFGTFFLELSSLSLLVNFLFHLLNIFLHVHYMLCSRLSLLELRRWQRHCPCLKTKQNKATKCKPLLYC